MGNLRSLKELEGATIFEVPLKFKEFADQHGVVDPIFAHGEKLKHSLREQNQILVNLSGLKWHNLITPPICCENYYEAIVLRFLHEVGHLVNQHPANFAHELEEEINRMIEQDYFTSIFSGIEGEAWRFALDLRKNDKQTYTKLITAAQKAFSVASLVKSIWKIKADVEFERVYNKRLKNAPFPMPKWVMYEYGKYLPRRMENIITYE